MPGRGALSGPALQGDHPTLQLGDDTGHTHDGRIWSALAAHSPTSTTRSTTADSSALSNFAER